MDVGAGGDERLDRVEMAEESRQADGREAIWRVGRGESWIVAQQLLDPIDAAERGGLEDIDRPRGIRERLGDVVLLVIDGNQSWRRATGIA